MNDIIMRIFFLLFLFIALNACKDPSMISKQLSGSDSLQINFNQPGTHNLVKTVSTTEQKAIEKLIRFVNGKATEAYKCGYDGNLMFFKEGTLLGDVAFNYSGAGCHHFVQEIKGVLTSSAMSNEAADFLKSLAEEKGWY